MTTDIKKLRVSSLPTAFKCPGSVRGDTSKEVLVDYYNEPAELGTATHAVLEQVVKQNLDELPELEPFAKQYEVEQNDLGPLCWYGLKAWRQLKEFFPNPLTEVEIVGKFGGVNLPGHADVLDFSDADELRIIDWKSGRKQSDYYHQQAGYAHNALMTYADPKKKIKSVRVIVVWLREQEYETYLFTSAELFKWRESLINEVLIWDGVFHPGDHCNYCKRIECPAKRQIVKATLADLADDNLLALLQSGDVKAVGPRLVDLNRRAGMVVKAAESLKDFLRELIREHGPLPAGDGRELALTTQNVQEIIPVKAWPIINEFMTNDQLAPAVKISKTTMLDIAAADAPRGGKGKLKAEIMNRLVEAGAVKDKPREMLREVKCTKEIK